MCMLGRSLSGHASLRCQPKMRMASIQPSSIKVQAGMHADSWSDLKATIASWRLGWNFTAKETIQGVSNVYTPGVDVLALDPPNVQLQGLNVNLTIKPFSWTEISFLGTKSTTPVPDAQYKASHSTAS